MVITRGDGELIGTGTGTGIGGDNVGDNVDDVDEISIKV